MDLGLSRETRDNKCIGVLHHHFSVFICENKKQNEAEMTMTTVRVKRWRKIKNVIINGRGVQWIRGFHGKHATPFFRFLALPLFGIRTRK